MRDIKIRSLFMDFFQWMEEQAQKLVDATARAFTQQQRLGPRPPQPAMAPPTALPYALVPGVGVPQGMPRPVGMGQMGMSLPPLSPGPYPPAPGGYAGGIPLPPMPYPQE